MQSQTSHILTVPERDAMGMDEYHPISKGGSLLTAAGGIGYTVVDSLDTMLIMGLTEEYGRAREWVENELSFDRDGEYNTFEVSGYAIRDIPADTPLTDHYSCSRWPPLCIPFIRWRQTLSRQGYRPRR